MFDGSTIVNVYRLMDAGISPYLVLCVYGIVHGVVLRILIYWIENMVQYLGFVSIQQHIIAITIWTLYCGYMGLYCYRYTYEWYRKQAKRDQNNDYIMQDFILIYGIIAMTVTLSSTIVVFILFR